MGHIERSHQIKANGLVHRWHFVIPILISLPCYIVYTYCGSIESLGGLRPVTLYGMQRHLSPNSSEGDLLTSVTKGLCFLANKISISQPAALTYRSMTLYGASEQAVGGAVTLAGLSIASIIGPQIFPSKDKPWCKCDSQIGRASCRERVCLYV